MAYKYTHAYRQIADTTQKQAYIDLFQETLNSQFYNASDWWTIEEETGAVASRVFENIDVRINHVINAETGIKLGDDWKTILFKDVQHPTRLGRLYRFESNDWLVINTEQLMNLTATATVKRCNNTLRWIDETTGAHYNEPCTIEYLIKEPRDYATAGSALVTPSGYLQIQAQLNERTNTIKPNQRFLFGNPGNWTAYKIVGTGTNNYNNLVTDDNYSAGILRIDMVANYLNYATDDLINGIADVTQNTYTFSILESSISRSVGQTAQLGYAITMNGDTVSRPVTWLSSNPLIATVSSTGLVTAVSNGSCVITAGVKDNPVTDTCSVVVSATPLVNREIVLSPNVNFILEKDKAVYSVYLYLNGVAQADVFTVTCNPNSVPLSSFVFTQLTGNTFSIENIEKSISSKLTLTAVSGIDSISFDIYLRGAY